MTRRFFSGSTLDQAVMMAARHYELDPEELAYRQIEKRHGFLRTRKAVMIAVDPEDPRREPAVAEAQAQEAPVQEAPVQEASVQEAPVQGASMQEAPVQEASVQGASMQEAPAPADADSPEPTEQPSPTEPFGPEVTEREPETHAAATDGWSSEDPAPEAGPGEDLAAEAEPAGSAWQEPTWEAPVEAPIEAPMEAPVEAPMEAPVEAAVETTAEPIEAPPAAAAAPPVTRAPDQDQRTTEHDEELLEAAADATRILMRFAGIDAEASAQSGGERVEVEIEGPDASLLVVEEGTGLLAIQHLLPRMLRGMTGRSSFVRADSQGFHQQRRERLEALALKEAEAASRTGTPRTLPPMAPDERRIVHLTLQDTPTVVTESRGTGLHKRVVIRPVGGDGGSDDIEARHGF